MTHNEIVVGLDDSPSGKAALRWAADQAIRRQAVLRAIHVLDWPFGPGDTTIDAPARSTEVTFDEAKATYLAGITRVFDDISPRPDWLIQFAKGEPGRVLVKESRDSQFLVIGTREHVGLGRLLSGSVSHYCLSHASCPVVSVPTLTDGQPAELPAQDASDGGAKANDIVVGVDLSPSARAALAWAAQEARATGQSVLAVHAIDNPAHRESITAVFESIQPEPGWRLDFFSGKAGPVLVSVSKGVAMLVVGTKEHVGIGRLVSGSVSHYCLGHALAPVVAVPTVRDRGADQDHGHASADRPATD